MPFYFVVMIYSNFVSRLQRYTIFCIYVAGYRRTGYRKYCLGE
ncbi:hypothetical protein PARMER_03632 [Parabacteroides merdae ATCC 43184]|nr:hypothetical protein PARMER_03632 [Parabacteroides merdae ATCC 43184]